MSRKSVATCYWFEIIFVLWTYVNKIWIHTLVNPYNIWVYCSCLLDLCNMNNVLVTSVWFNIDIYVYLNQYKTSESSNMSLPTSDSFCLITTHILNTQCIHVGYLFDVYQYPSKCTVMTVVMFTIYCLFSIFYWFIINYRKFVG